MKKKDKVDDKYNLSKQFEAWRQSKSPEFHITGHSQDSFFFQNANCNYLEFSNQHIVTDYKLDKEIKLLQSGDQGDLMPKVQIQP